MLSFYKKIACISLLFFCTFSIHAQYTVESIKMIATKPLNRGIFYYLPQNGIHVKVTIEKTIYKKGIYGNYAEKLLGISNFIEHDNCIYKIKSVQLSNTVYADPEQQYFLYSKSGNIPSIALSNNGILLSVNDPKPNFVVDNLNYYKTLHRNITTDEKEENRSSVGSLGVKAPFADLNIYQKYDTTHKEIWVDSTMFFQTILTPVSKTKSLEQKAEEIANLIIESKKYRTDLLSGMQEVNYAPETIRFMIDNLLQTENEYMESFTGIISSSEESFDFEIKLDTSFSYPLAFFDSETGLEQLKDGDYLRIEPGSEDVLFLNIKPLPFGGNNSVSFEQNNIDPSSSKGIFYRQPLTVLASFAQGKNTLKQQQLFISQWGETLCLPISKDKMILLNPQTGALIYIGEPFEHQNIKPYSRRFEYGKKDQED